MYLDNTFGFHLCAMDTSGLIFYIFSAAITVRFRALASSGLLFYVADSTVSPSTWMSMYLQNGHLVFNVQTNSMNSESIQSDYKYNDGLWWEATLLLLYNFMALVCSVM